MNISRSYPILSLCMCILFLAGPGLLKAQDKDEGLELYYSANALYNRKLYSLARDEYEKLLDRYPRHEKASQARMGLALCLYAMGDKKAAEPLFAQLTREASLSNQQEIHNLWGQCLLGLDRPDEAEKAFAWSADRGGDPEQKIHAQVGRIEALYRQSKWAEVIQESDRFIGQNPGSTHMQRVNFQGAVARFETGQFQAAGQQLASIVNPREKTPFMQHIAFLLAECRRELDDTQEAIKYYDLAARKMNGAFTADALYRLGFIRFQNGSFSEAARDFEELLDEHGASPSAMPARLYLGRCHLEKGNLREAERIFDAFPPSSEEYGSSRLWLARTHVQKNDLEASQRVLDRALEKAGDSPVRSDLMFEAANVRMERGRFDEAAKGFGEICRVFPGAPLTGDALWLEAYCLHKASAFQESLERCDAHLDRYPRSGKKAEVSFLKAENLFLLDRLAEAEPLYRNFLSGFEDHFYANCARFRIAQSLYYGKKWQAALEALTPLLEEERDAPFFNQALYICGDCRYNLEQWNQAVEAFLIFTRDHPGEANVDLAAFKVALALENQGDRERAASALQSFVRTFENSPYLSNVHVELGRLSYEDGKYKQARRCFEEAKKAGEIPFAEYYMGYIAIAEGDDEGAVNHFDALIRRHPDHALTPDARLQQGILQVRRQDFAAGQEALEGFLRSHGDHDKADQAHFYLGVALARQSRWDEATRAFQNVLTRYGDSPLCDRALYEWAWCEKGRERKDLAARRYEAFLQAFPESALAPEVVFELAELEYEAKEHASAIGRLESLIQSGAEGDLRERACYRLGWNHFQSGHFSDAARWFEAVLEEFPDSSRSAVALYQAGEARLKLKEHEESYGHFRRLADLGGRNAYREQTLLRLGECAALTQRWREAEETYRRFVKEFPESEFMNQALFGQGWAQENQNRYNDAIEAYGKVLARGRFDETSARCQFQIGECYFSMKKYDEAVKALIKVEVMYAYPQWSSKALLETGRVLDLLGKKEEARDRYQELIQKYPDDDAAVVARKKLKDA